MRTECLEEGCPCSRPSFHAEREVLTISTQINYTELEKRLNAYLKTEDFQCDLEAAANDYRALGLPVPPADVLRDKEITALRRSMEAVMICEAKGHRWKERADQENGTSELTCRRCGQTEHLRW